MCDKKTFDELANLFNSDPAAFDKYKQEHLTKHIADMCSDCPEHLERCQRFQWRLDQELAKHKNPIVRYNKMVELFWEQTEKFKSVLQLDVPEKPETSASVIQFPGKE